MNIYIYMYLHIHVYMHVFIFAYTQYTHACVCIYIYMCTYIHILCAYTWPLHISIYVCMLHLRTYLCTLCLILGSSWDPVNPSTVHILLAFRWCHVQLHSVISMNLVVRTAESHEPPSVYIYIHMHVYICAPAYV